MLQIYFILRCSLGSRIGCRPPSRPRAIASRHAFDASAHAAMPASPLHTAGVSCDPSALVKHCTPPVV
jgi:hypothetical protein